MLDEEGTLTFPENKTEIGDYEFSLGKNNILTEVKKSLFKKPVEPIIAYHIKKIIFGANIRKIGVHAFDSCFNLLELDFSKCINIIIIQKKCFLNCLLLKKIILPKSIKYIDEYAFAYCLSLTDVILYGIEEINTGGFYSCPIKVLHIPCLKNYVEKRNFLYNPIYDEICKTEYTGHFS
jgi:hypothetical protein